MKILALEKDVGKVDWPAQTKILGQESHAVYELYVGGIIREIYFNENKQAILILECNDLHEAKRKLNDLPLVKAKLTIFEFIELRPYTGFARL